MIAKETFIAGDKVLASEINQVAKNANDSGFRDDINAGESITAFRPVFLDEATGKWKFSDANDIARLNFDGIALEAGTNNNPLKVQVSGIARGLSSLTPGAKYFVQDDGTIGTTPGTSCIFVGVAVKATELAIAKNDPEELFGTGADGDVVISTDTTLTGDKNYNNLTVNNGITLNAGGYKISVKNTLTNNGVISRAGIAGGNSSNQFAGAGGSALSGGSLAGNCAGAIGGNGAESNHNGYNGTGVNSPVPASVNNSAVGGDGGNCTGGYSGGLGAGATIITPEAIKFEQAPTPELVAGSENVKINLKRFVPAGGISGETLSAGAGGGGGGGGADCGGSFAWGGGGGGGGSSGAVLLIIAKKIINNGTITVKGGNGGNGGNASNIPSYSCGGGGGGAGGAGGLLVLIYRQIAGGTIDYTGGAGGTGGSGRYGGGNGATGGVGSSGLYYPIKIV